MELRFSSFGQTLNKHCTLIKYVAHFFETLQHPYFYRWFRPRPVVSLIRRIEMRKRNKRPDEGESVFVEGVKDATLREQLRAFLAALGLALPAVQTYPENREQNEKQRQGFQCSRGGGGVLKTVAALMDERGLAEPPPMDREAAFIAAKEVSC